MQPSLQGDSMKNGFGDMFGGMFGPVPKGDCRLGMNGLVAVNVNTGGTPDYKTYDVKTGKLTNCTEFSMELDGSFFLIPTMKVAPGDIILSAGGPCCVIEGRKNAIRVFSYQRGTIEELVPERHIFMGSTYCYAKIFSPLANMMKGRGGMGNAVKMMMLSKLFSDGGSSPSGTGMNPMMLMMLAGGGKDMFRDLFDGAFDPEEDDDEKED